MLLTRTVGHEKLNTHHHNRPENRPGKERTGQRARKLQLSDVDWYEASLNTHRHFSGELAISTNEETTGSSSPLSTPASVANVGRTKAFGKLPKYLRAGKFTMGKRT